MTEPTEATTAGRPVLALDIESEASDFCRERSLEVELDLAIDFAMSSFPGTVRLSLSLLEDPDDGQTSLVAELENALPRREFREASVRFFRSLSERGCDRLRVLLAVVQE